MKLVPRLIIALALCILALSFIATPIQASSTILLSQNEGCVGDKINVSGEGFRTGDVLSISYDGKVIRTTVVEQGGCLYHGKFTADITIPESCQGYHNIVAKDEGDRTATARFTVKPKISLEKISGRVGDIIKARGTGFAREGTGINIRYYLDTDSHSGWDKSPHVDFPVAKVNTSGSWEQTFVIPPSIKGTHSIDAYYSNDESTLNQVNNKGVKLEVRPGITLNPDSGCVGDTITIAGAGFAPGEGGIKLRYDGSGEFAAEDADESGSWEISFTIPPSVKGSHVIQVLNSGTVISSATFTVVPGISLSPAEGYVGQKFSVTGSAFDPNTAVKISYQGQTVDITTDVYGNFPAVAFTATGEHGEQQVTATYNGNSTPPAIFYMEEVPPDKPNLLSPINNQKADIFGSFTGKIHPTFKWSDVPDASGIASYELQLSQSPDFTAPIASFTISENPHATNDAVAYALPGENALSYGSYYWRVKAIDAAANEGEWSEPQPFHAGWLPRWAMIAITVVIVLLVAAISFIITRRIRSGHYHIAD